ncbi:MAG: DNA helicase RecQ [Anaerohalosphaera sp.]|nr:DNA helicase RecQ [Anaerohalosphaera sp.]
MLSEVEKSLKQYWGYDEFLPLQRRAIECSVSGRDSIVVLPTGGGKSLCYQAPAVSMDGMAVVVSPLISLMKDQVDSLLQCGVSAARLDSSMTVYERDQVIKAVSLEQVKLLYMSPEKLVSEGFIEFLQGFKLSLIAIDEAHCVSMWGHDFRPEYRQLSCLKEMFPGVAVHAYTATATENVRGDIAVQLKLSDHEMLIGSFDRANLIYKVEQVQDKVSRVCRIVEENKGNSGIVYCIRRKDVDEMFKQLSARGVKALPYHAGMDAEARRINQEAFDKERVDVMVATIAFGMGIDKSNVRYVVHAGMPKSLENYQQEAGRAGRDGLEAQCYLLYSNGDYQVWKFILSQTDDLAAKKVSLDKLSEVYNFCHSMNCRHAALVEYFGQNLDKDNCSACDVCLGDVEEMEEALIVAQKILSCVVRLNQSFGADQVSMVLTGSKDKRVTERRHDQLSTYGLLKDFSKGVVRDWTEQLVSQGYLAKQGEFNVVCLTKTGGEVLKGLKVPRLLKPLTDKPKPARKSKVVEQAWEGVDHGLFERLRQVRKEQADLKGVPAFVVFGDAALRDMARIRPTTKRMFNMVKGVGQAKSTKYGKKFMREIAIYCKEHSVGTDVV